MRTRANIVAAALALSLGACAGLGMRLEPPTVDVIAARLDRVQEATAQIGVTVELGNPNDAPLDVTAFDAALAIEGEVVAKAMLTAPVRVPAKGRAKAELVAVTGMDALLRAGIAAMRRGVAAPPGHAPTLDYAIEGTAIWNGGLRVPFYKRGTLGSQGSR